MQQKSANLIFCILFSSVQSKEPDLPLCPANIQYLPQNLPMHCRMPTNSDYNFPTLPPFPTNFFSLPPGKFPESIPGLPGAGAAISMSMPIPMQMPMPLAMPMPPMPPPAHKLPVVVMPLYSPDKSFQKRKERKHKRPRHVLEDSTDTDTSTDDSSDTSADEHGWWRRSNAVRKPHRHRHQQKHNIRPRNYRREELITPVLQYVTKEGYVIFEKQISKGEAKDWIHIKNDNQNEVTPSAEEPDQDSYEAKEQIHGNKIMSIDKAKTPMKPDRILRKHPKKQVKNISNN